MKKIKLNKSSVLFDQYQHKYWLNGKELSGVTTLLGNTIFKDKYKGIDKEVLNAAAKRGTIIHEQCELADTIGITPDSVEAQNYLYLKEDNGLESVANEYLISDNEHIASSIDLVAREKETGLIDLCDIKTTSELDRNYVSWQLSIYAYLFELQNPKLKVNKLYGIWLRGDKSKLVEVNRISEDVVKELIQSYFEGSEFVNPLTPDVPSQITECQLALIDIDRQAKELSDRKKQLMDGIKLLMEEHNVKQYKTDLITLTYVEQTTKEVIDSKKLQSEQPELYKQYLKTSKVNSSVRLTVNKNAIQSKQSITEGAVQAPLQQAV